MKKLIKIIIILTLITGSISPAVPVRAETVIDILNINVALKDDGETAVITWTTNVATNGKVVFGFVESNLKAYVEDSRSASRSHSVELSNLQPQTDYFYQVVAWDSSTKVYSFVDSFDTDDYDDTNAPTITNLRVPYVTADIAVISWETNEAADSRVEFDDQETYLYKANSSSRVTRHFIKLTNLRADTEYWARVQSKDKDNNYSSQNYISFYTNNNTGAKGEDLVLSYLRPSTENDSQITDASITVSFKTNHIALGDVVLKKSGSQSQTIKLDYATEHRATFLDLEPDSEYTIAISLKDIFNKTVKESLIVKTKPVAVLGASAVYNPLDVSQYAAVCSSNIFSQSGLYGQYYNAELDRRQTIDSGPEETGWYTKDKFVKSQVDSNLGFGKSFYALKGNNGQNLHFAAYWRAVMAVPADGLYSYTIVSDDDSWVVIDGETGIHSQASESNQMHNQTVSLSKGLHLLEVYYIYRGRSGSNMNFGLENSIALYPLPTDCGVNWEVSGGRLYSLSGAGGGISSGGNGSTGSGGVSVLGADHSRYTRITAVYKTPASPDVYVIMNGQAHYVSSPSSFTEYGLKWSDIKTISENELNKYPRARLIKSADKATIYYLYQRPENKWLKIALNSPTVFVSYPDNYWGNVLTVTQTDVDNYPEVKLIRARGELAVYFLEDNAVKHFISAQVFIDKGFNKYEVAEVSRVHLDSFLTGEPLK